MVAAIEVREGTYQVIVHIIEARGLSAASGLTALFGRGNAVFNGPDRSFLFQVQNPT
jgi:hypothetical protein